MIEVLAPAIVANFLLPYIKDGVEAIAKKVAASAGEAAGTQAVNLTKQVWNRVKRLFGNNPDDEAEFNNFERYKGATAEVLQARLAELLASHPDAKQELEELVDTRELGTDRTLVSVIGNSGVTTTITATGGSTVSGNTITGTSYGAGPPASR